MTTNTLPEVVVDASGQPQQKAGRIDTDPAIKSFKTVEALNVASRRQELLGFGVGSFIAGFSIVTTGVGAIMMAENGLSPINAGTVLMFVGAALFFGAGAINAYLKLVATYTDDIRIMTDLKIYAKSLQDTNINLHLRASMKDAHGAGEAVGDLGASTPTATITSINAGKTGRLQ